MWEGSAVSIHIALEASAGSAQSFSGCQGGSGQAPARSTLTTQSLD
jgi:hypothetical protein